MPNWVAAFEELSKCYCCYLTSVAAPLSVASIFCLRQFSPGFSQNKNLITFQGFLFLLFVYHLDCFLGYDENDLINYYFLPPSQMLCYWNQVTLSSCFFINMPTKPFKIIFFIYYSPSSNQGLPSVFHIPRDLKGDQDSQPHKITNLKRTLQNQFSSWLQWQQSNWINTNASTWRDPNTAQIIHYTPRKENIQHYTTSSISHK